MAVQRILVKAKVGLAKARVSFSGAPVDFQAVELFPSIGRTLPLSLAGGSTWYVLESPPGFTEPNGWDVCHALMQSGFGVDGASAPEFAEPDLAQTWTLGEPRALGSALAASCSPDGQDKTFPHDPQTPYWFRDDNHSQFDSALNQIGGADVAAQVRIAHFDTGYDPAHKYLPRRLKTELARNFVDPGRLDDASDISDGVLDNLGHGTGTLGVLAGGGPDGETIGAAPFAEIVPVRVANRVVLFYNSAIARAFDYVHGLYADPATRVDVITMSMGGVASQAWAEAVNALYERGVLVVAAAGNNFGSLPTRNIVYPARFNRVVAACGVMANGAPYADFDIARMAGNYGPDSKMDTAIAACTPNVPWPRLGCPETLDFNGRGTSAATPQVAAAAAIWIQTHRTELDQYQPWQRVEAVRQALFESAAANSAEKRRLGRGTLKASDALGRGPAQSLTAAPEDSASFPILRMLTGLGLQGEGDARSRMMELEALQLSQSAAIEQVLPDPQQDPTTLPASTLRQIAEALATHPGASQSLRAALEAAEPERVSVTGFLPPTSNAVARLHLEHAAAPVLPLPTYRPLRVYAQDPSLGARLETLGINEATLNVVWEEKLERGPVGEYLEVIDIDPASDCCYAPVDLNHPHLLVQSGLPPSEANPQFHQQMVYAVAMKTIEHFESALGRVALWAPHRVKDVHGRIREEFVRRLRIYPHAVRAKNAFYSPDRKALLMGYFRAESSSGDVLPGGVVFTAVSHDIIAHETTHALLDGLHRRFREPTNKDVLAFHEAFADIVALFQHFTLPEALRFQIARTRGDLEQQSLLGELAVQFGHATGRYGALRNAIGEIKDGKWVRSIDPTILEKTNEPHKRGAVLVAAVFDTFLQIYKHRTADLVRLATGGTGILPQGNISADLVDRLAHEASKVAGHVLRMCIRALDYCPPVDLTFGEYLRALITADAVLVPNDPRGYRVAFISSFRGRGIYPADVKHLSSGSLVWEKPPLPLKNIATVLRTMQLDWDLSVERKKAYDLARDNAAKMQKWLMDTGQVSDEEIASLGLFRDNHPSSIGGVSGKLGRIEVHSVRPAQRIGPDGQSRSDLVVEITQTFRPEAEAMAPFRGGCTLLIDLEESAVRYLVRKKVDSPYRFGRQREMSLDSAHGLHANYFSDPLSRDEPFALLHQDHG